MRSTDVWANAQSLHQFFDHLSDMVLLLDRQSRISFANTAALRSWPCETGMPLDQLRGMLGDAALRWVHRRVNGLSHSRVPVDPPPQVTLANGRSVHLAWQPLDATCSALRLQLGPEPSGASAEPELPKSLSNPDVADLVRVFWKSPFPTALQDETFRIVDINEAYLEFSGFTRERLIGVDPLDLQPQAEREANREIRDNAVQAIARADVPPLVESRMVDASGRERWFRAARSVMVDDAGRRLYLIVLQDSTAEHAARERADRSARELDDWFDLSPLGMVLFDEVGLLVRTNPAFDALVGEVPALLSESLPSLQQLLMWSGAAPSPQLQPGANPVVAVAWLPQPDGTQRRLRSIVRCYRTAGGRRRYMAVVEDRSIEEERDLAQMQIGALMDTAGVGLATFQESSGWVRQRQAPGSDAPTSAALRSINREIVAPESLPEYERLQHALRHAQRAEVRYAVRHPELGYRWLLTRVEPATLASGKRTTSVVTLDITEQQQTQQRSEQLLHEMTTILESTTAGIAYLRGNVLVRCNQRFEAMLGLAGTGVAGSSIHELFGSTAQAQRIAADTLQALTEGDIYETEFELAAAPGSEQPAQWYSLSVRRTGPVSGSMEAIAVLSDITRLKGAEQAVALQADRTRAILDSVLVGIVTVGPRGIEWMNRSARRMFGGDLADFVDLPISTVATEEPQHPFRQTQYLDDLVEGQAETFECRVNARDGREFWVVGNAVATGESSERQLTYALLDIERRREAEARTAQAQASLHEAALAQREMLVKEVHHRIKNNLQGVAGLLQQMAARKPEVAAIISEVVGQVQAIAQVYGLQVGVTGPLRLRSVIEAITGSVQRAFGHPIVLTVEGAAPHQWALPDSESIPIALSVNELLTNAVKHSMAEKGEGVTCKLLCRDDGVHVVITNRAHLPLGFTLARFPGGVSGLGLVRSLLPRRSAGLTVEQHGDDVVATVALAPPGITKLEQA